MRTLENFLEGRWRKSETNTRPLFNPATGEQIAEASSDGLDVRAGVEYARDVGNLAVRSLTFADRGTRLKQMAGILFKGQDKYVAMSIQNSGVTKNDALVDILGAAMVLSNYAKLGKNLGDTRFLTDAALIQLKGWDGTPALSGIQTYHARRGVAVHINAHNFPLWNAMEKFAQAFLAGMPSIESPATATALVLEHYVREVMELGALPDGALSLLMAGSRDLVHQLGNYDSLAFTGSMNTGWQIRNNLAGSMANPKSTYEQDSINSAFIGPDVDVDSLTWKIAVSQVVNEMTQKSGQKCTATRVVYVPEDKREAFYEAVQARLSKVVIGDPSQKGVTMGPVVSKAESQNILLKIGEYSDRIAEPSQNGTLTGSDDGYFVVPHVFTSGAQVEAIYGEEIFGPVLTVLPYSGKAEEVGKLLQKADGTLVTSAYSNNRDWLAEVSHEAGGQTGRLYVGNDNTPKNAFGPGIVDPQMTHGGPGRAGNGRELGNRLGMDLYLDDLAVQGPEAIVAHLAQVKAQAD